MPAAPRRLLLPLRHIARPRPSSSAPVPVATRPSQSISVSPPIPRSPFLQSTSNLVPGIRNVFLRNSRLRRPAQCNPLQLPILSTSPASASLWVTPRRAATAHSSTVSRLPLHPLPPRPPSAVLRLLFPSRASNAVLCLRSAALHPRAATYPPAASVMPSPLPPFSHLSSSPLSAAHRRSRIHRPTRRPARSLARAYALLRPTRALPPCTYALIILFPCPSSSPPPHASPVPPPPPISESSRITPRPPRSCGARPTWPSSSLFEPYSLPAPRSLPDRQAPSFPSRAPLLPHRVPALAPFPVTPSLYVDVDRTRAGDAHSVRTLDPLVEHASVRRAGSVLALLVPSDAWRRASGAVGGRVSCTPMR
ncbi:hypothetical protein B0H15DRAFT_538237 [Mycena belliarum]|uniref:Uncharacterized protein n=1 Tax=Mycena belliarum TaxID=1033014 RepID=A0AAD6TUQ7_9AGAR|nr:hypothetical protein B0H15DRAFT_538237 [Mycena belliae]